MFGDEAENPVTGCGNLEEMDFRVAGERVGFLFGPVLFTAVECGTVRLSVLDARATEGSLWPGSLEKTGRGSS